MRRREFLIGTAGVAGYLSTARLLAQAQGKLARVGVSSGNFDAMLKQAEGPVASAARTLDFLDLPQMIADKFGVHNLGLRHSHFFSTEDAYLKEFRDRVAKAKSQIAGISTDFQTSSLSSNSPTTRAQAIDLAKVWVDHAEALGCPRVSVNAGSLAEPVRKDAIEALKILADYAKAHKVTITVQNLDDGKMPPAPPPPPPPAAPAGPAGAPAAAAGRGRAGGPGVQPMPPANWQTLVEVIKAAGAAAAPDTGGFPSASERAAGLKALYPLSGGNSLVRFGAGRSDAAAAVKIAKDVGYKGLFTVVVDAGGSDPTAMIKAAIDELAKLI
jgi:hypothetical protein